MALGFQVEILFRRGHELRVEKVVYYAVSVFK